MQRRKFLEWSSLAGLLPLFSMSAVAQAHHKPGHGETGSAVAKPSHHDAVMQDYAALVGGPKLVIGMLVYPGMFLQDLVGPLTVFESLMNRDIHLLWKTKDWVADEHSKPPALVPVKATTTFAECPEQLDVLFVPGGVPGTFAMMEDAEVLGFLAEKGKTARYVASVCTGSLILGAAGLLRGYKATTYWSLKDVLPELGAIPTEGRVVVDRNRVTGGGVTAGIDFALQLVTLLRSREYAEAVQLYLEYYPEPPFSAKSPDEASPMARQFLNDMFKEMHETALQTAKRATLKQR
jgi:cyclohexyl-isocyanide hydratase